MMPAPRTSPHYNNPWSRDTGVSTHPVMRKNLRLQRLPTQVSTPEMTMNYIRYYGLPQYYDVTINPGQRNARTETLTRTEMLAAWVEQNDKAGMAAEKGRTGSPRQISVEFPAVLSRANLSSSFLEHVNTPTVETDDGFTEGALTGTTTELEWSQIANQEWRRGELGGVPLNYEGTMGYTYTLPTNQGERQMQLAADYSMGINDALDVVGKQSNRNVIQENVRRVITKMEKEEPDNYPYIEGARLVLGEVKHLHRAIAPPYNTVLRTRVRDTVGNINAPEKFVVKR